MKIRKIQVKKNEEKIVPFVWFDSGDRMITLEGKLQHEGGRIHIVGLFFGTGKSQVVFNTIVSHIAHNTRSRTTIRAVFLNKSSFANDGLIRIVKGAKNSDGYFSSKILLFDDAKGKSVPSLEIHENELKAGHASTVGRPDPDQLFYLKSRGISGNTAEKIIISGFFSPLLPLIPVNKQRELQKRIDALI